VTFAGLAHAEGLRVVVVEGESALNSIEARRAKEPVVRVEDEEGRPVTGAAVTFILPMQGAGGYFDGREASLTVTTGAGGIAVGRGLKPNNAAGPFIIRATASSGGRTATVEIHQTNVAPPTARGNAKRITLLAIIGGAAVGGVLAATRGGGGTAPAGSAAVSGSASGGTTVQSGTPVFGPPR
jgi:hypothetical protein